MSSGIDQSFVLDYYQKMTNEEMLRTLKGGLKSLTPEAREIIVAEVTRRKLDIDLSTILVAEENEYEGKAYDPDACPVEEPNRIRIEQAFLLLLDLFGEEATLTRQILLPEAKYFPVKYDGSQRSVLETLRIVAGQMEVAHEQIKLAIFDERQAQNVADGLSGFYGGKGEDGRFEISLVNTLIDKPENMVAVMAHEIAHIKLLGENRIQENDEVLTELTTIFFGLGVFNANAAFQTETTNRYYMWSTSGYLTQMEWGYALALFAYIRQEENPEWVKHLCKNVKGDFNQGQRFILNNEGLIFQQQ